MTPGNHGIQQRHPDGRSGPVLKAGAEWRSGLATGVHIWSWRNPWPRDDPTTLTKRMIHRQSTILGHSDISIILNLTLWPELFGTAIAETLKWLKWDSVSLSVAVVIWQYIFSSYQGLVLMSYSHISLLAQFLKYCTGNLRPDATAYLNVECGLMSEKLRM